MKTLSQKTELEQKIAHLKYRQEKDFINLKSQYYSTIDSFKPINLIKNSFEDVLVASNLKTNLMNGAIKFGASYVTQKFLNPTSESPIKKVFGKVLKFALKNFIGSKSKNI